MGAYLAKPKTEKISDGSENGRLRYGVSCMQGWRVTMEDAHTCELDFDDSSTLFAVYDGHGGSEVAQYVAKKLPEVLKNTENYQKGDIKQSMVDCFLEIDQLIISEKGLAELKELAGLDKDLDEEEDLEMLEQEAMMPLNELLAKMKEMKKAKDGDNDGELLEQWTEDGNQSTADDKENNHCDTNKENEIGSKNDKKDEAIIENGDTIKAGTCSSDSVENSTNGSLKNGKEEKEKDTEESENDHKMQQKEVKETSEGEQATNESEKNEEKIPNDEAIDDEEEEGDEDDEEDDDEDDDDDDDDDDDEDGAPFQSSDEVGYDSGTTAIVAVLRENQLTVANVGDSRCVLCRNGIALEMSTDHKPEDEHELNRIHKAGGKVTCEGRVNGGLNLSRALGDHSYKLQTELSAHEQQITAVPDVRQTQITEADEFMVIACDGIWNVKGSQEVVDFVSDRLREQRQKNQINLAQICEELLDACLAPDTSGDGSGCDNMTSIVVLFNSDSKATENNKKRKLEDEKPDSESADKRIKGDES
ncbi:unnamed protein product [Porites lobata]|uniref:protein-serine/threonine phosphatase n=1 Tax=Porites lobata TaxID=104759 RepID=A0ABN8R4J3_9CNID|nr:unnamed protein product [Porites lobata]